MGKTIARIYLSHFEHNIYEIKKVAPNKKICLALKANAYGHGAVTIANKALKMGIEFLSVATVSEAVELRNASITAPILLLSLCHKDEIPLIVQYSITPLVADFEFVNLLHAEIQKNGVENFPVHIKIDTGMARHGVQEENALALAQHIQSMGLFIEGTCTHFSVSDSTDPDDIQFTKKQIEIFNRVARTLSNNDINPGILHCAASGGIVLHPDSHFDMVRPGILAYGYFPSKELHTYFSQKSDITFKPVMELVSYITALKEIGAGESVSYGRKWMANKSTQIATLSSGYGDGYNRDLSGNSYVTIHSKQYPIVGRICMDQCVISLENDNTVKRWDEAILFGPMPHCNSAMDLAIKLNTIPYEVLCLITNRVERKYID